MPEVVENLDKSISYAMNGLFLFVNSRSSKLCAGVEGFDRNRGRNIRGIKTAKQPNTIAKTTLGRAKSDILYNRDGNID